MTLGEFDFSKDISALDPVSLEPPYNHASWAPSTTWAPSQDFDLSDSSLNDVEKVQLHQLLTKYSDIFATHPHDLGRTHLASHKILVDHSVPIKQRPYCVLHAHKQDVTDHVHDMSDHHLIRPSQSPWSSPVIIVPKKDGGTRFVVDYRKLNSLTKKDSYHLPRIDDTLDCLGGAAYFSVVNFCSGYFHIPLDDDSKQYTAFSTQDGPFEFEVMPFGLCNALSTFQRLMETTLRGLQWQICLVYIDDVIIYFKTFNDYLLHLATVFDRLRTAGLKLKPSNCRFSCHTVPYLGFVATSQGKNLTQLKSSLLEHIPLLLM